MCLYCTHTTLCSSPVPRPSKLNLFCVTFTYFHAHLGNERPGSRCLVPAPPTNPQCNSDHALAWHIYDDRMIQLAWTRSSRRVRVVESRVGNSLFSFSYPLLSSLRTPRPGAPPSAPLSCSWFPVPVYPRPPAPTRLSRSYI